MVLGARLFAVEFTKLAFLLFDKVQLVFISAIFVKIKISCN